MSQARVFWRLLVGFINSGLQEKQAVRGRPLLAVSALRAACLQAGAIDGTARNGSMIGLFGELIMGEHSADQVKEAGKEVLLILPYRESHV
jgi:hypothetical protein